MFMPTVWHVDAYLHGTYPISFCRFQGSIPCYHHCNCTLFLPKEARCVCRQAAGKGGQIPTPCWTRPDPSKTQSTVSTVLSNCTARQPGIPNTGYYILSREAYARYPGHQRSVECSSTPTGRCELGPLGKDCPPDVVPGQQSERPAVHGNVLCGGQQHQDKEEACDGYNVRLLQPLLRPLSAHQHQRSTRQLYRHLLGIPTSQTSKRCTHLRAIMTRSLTAGPGL